METAIKKKNFYPHFEVANNKTPNRLYAFPLLGFLVKVILLIPVFIEMFFLSFFSLGLLIINWFIVLFTGEYWDYAYQFFVKMMQLGIKVQLFIYGITDKYPGFSLSSDGLFTLTVAKPEKPNRWLAIPFVGFFVRCILLIPYFIFSSVLSRGANLAMFFSWFIVLFKGKFPESLYEFERDNLRVAFATNVYLVGLSDTYPSFHISMNHQTVKILLIIAGALMVMGSFADRPSHDKGYSSVDRSDVEYMRDSSY